jgi:HSP20 family protein
LIGLSIDRWSYGWVDELVDKVYEEFTRPSWSATDCCLTPLMEIENKENEIIVTADLPYVQKKEDIIISATEYSLEITAKLKEAVRWERWGTIQRQLSFTTFKKSISLPVKVDPNKSKASFRKGILKIVLPKAEKKFSIEIQ